MVKESQAMSRYSHPCPACGASIRPADVPFGDGFPCPACGEWLQYDHKHSLSILAVSILGATILTWHFGYRGGMLVLIATCATLLLCASGFFLVEIFDPSGFKRVQGGKREPFDKALSLFVNDKPDGNKKTDP